MPPGSGWVQVTMFRLSTHDQFDPLGSLEPYFAEGHLITTSLLATAAVGVFPGVEARFHVPVHSLRFGEVTGSRDEVFPTLGVPIGSGSLEIGARVPIDGRNLPAGNAVSLSFFLPWGLSGPSVVGMDEFP